MIFRQILFITTILCLFFFYTGEIDASISVEDYFQEENLIDKPSNATDDPPSFANDNNEEKGDTPSVWMSFLKMLLALVIVVGLIIFISKFLQKKKGFLQQNQLMENYGGISVGANKSVQTVRVGERYLVIGVGDNIDVLMEITEPETINLLNKESNSETTIDHLKNKWTKQSDNNDSDNILRKDFQQLFAKELNSMKDGRKQILNKMKEKKNRS
ncbi:flagellar biosynthetic protein FliO [Gracilibacillus sp. YIM 98692]|uniref:flagellar biosynthetic protein FliO n=1 Tax=Gracilibacillus sp. YIM 98692 TaxID=2663532 RepID=UPI0013D39596|nr:flagellar biosynthetic protein FliO [Gracilibacillus sp. YIM 98692]